MTAPSDRIIDLYREGAADWIESRGRVLFSGEGGPDEGVWLERFTQGLAPGATILDVGCGSGWPIAAELLRRGFAVTGMDTSEGLLDHARATLPHGRWIQGDMRVLELEETFDGVIAWHSLFHLTPEDQEVVVPKLAARVAPGGRLMFTSGPARGEALGAWRGEALYHGSLDPEDYRRLLTHAGLIVEAGARPDAPGPGTAWLARRPLSPSDQG